MRQSNTRPLKNLSFHLLSSKTRRLKLFGSRKNRPQSITMLPVQLNKKQTDPSNATVENERQT